MDGIIQEITFENWNGRSLNGAGSVLADMLKSAKSIVFDDVDTDDDVYDCILQHVPNLKCLTLRNFNFHNNNWLQQIFPKLEVLNWHSTRIPDADKLKLFLDINPTVKQFSLVSNDAESISKLMANSVMIDELFFALECTSSEEQLSDDGIFKINILMKLCAAENVKLHLLISNADVISQLGQLHSSVFGFNLNITVDERVLDTMHTFENLQYLRISASHLPYAYNDMIAKMPNLTEVYIDQIYFWEEDVFHQTLLAMVSQSVKLTKVYLRGSEESIAGINFEAMNQERMELKDASHLKMYIDSNNFFAKFPLNFIEFDMIDIVCASTEPSDYPFFLNVRSTNYSPDDFWYD